MLFETRDPNDVKKFNRKEKLKVYHRTKDENLSLIGRDGFRSGKGNAWGDGIYACYDLISTTKENPYNSGNTREKTYGPVIIENEVLSLKDYLIFDYDAAKQYYGKDYSIKSQIKKIVPIEVYENNRLQIEDAHNICLAHRDYPLKNLYTTGAVNLIYEIDGIMDHVRGIVFTGSNDGKVLLSYDRENLVPINYSKDGGKDWIKVKDKGSYRVAKENFFNLIKSTNDIDYIVNKVKDRINNVITSRLGAGKKIDDLSYSEIKYIKSEFDYIFKESPNSRFSHLFLDSESDEYKLYKQSLDVIKKEFDGFFQKEFSKFNDYVNKIDWSKDIISIIKKLNDDFALLYSDSSEESKEVLDKIRIKVLDVYAKNFLRKLSEISKDDDIFNKFLELIQEYKYTPSTNSSRLIDDWSVEYSSLFSKYGGMFKFIEFFNIYDEQLYKKIISDISDNLDKKVGIFLSSLNMSRLDNIIQNVEWDKDDIYNLDGLFNEYKYVTYLSAIIPNYYTDALAHINKVIKEDKFYIKNNEKNFKELSEILLISYDKICKIYSKYFEMINKASDNLINDYKGTEIVIDKKTFNSFLNSLSSDIAGDDNSVSKASSKFIFLIAAIKDNTFLNKLIADGFLSERTSKLLKLMFISKTFKKGEIGKYEIELLDFQETRSRNEYEKEFNNPEFIGIFRAELSSKENYELFKKLKYEGKDVSNWNTWITILLCHDFFSIRGRDIGIREQLNLTKKESLNSFISLNLNIFSDKNIERLKEIENIDTSKYLIDSLTGKFFRECDDSDIDLCIEYLNKIKDNTNEKYYYLIIFNLFQQKLNNDNKEKLKTLIGKEDFLSKNIHMLSYEDSFTLAKLFKYNLIKLSDIIKGDTKEPKQFENLKLCCANYKLRKILKENNLEKIKSYLKFLKENNISISSSNDHYELEYENIDLKSLNFEIIDLMLINDQITFYDLSKIADDDLIRKTLKYIDKAGYYVMLDCIEDPDLKQKVEIEFFSKSNNYDWNFDIFLKNFRKLDINKIIEDLNKSYTKNNNLFFDVLLIILIANKKDEVLNKIDKNIFTAISSDILKEFDGVLPFSEVQKEIIKKEVELKELSTIENFKMTLNSISKYLPENVKKRLKEIFVFETSERIIFRFNSFVKSRLS